MCRHLHLEGHEEQQEDEEKEEEQKQEKIYEPQPEGCDDRLKQCVVVGGNILIQSVAPACNAIPQKPRPYKKGLGQRCGKTLSATHQMHVGKPNPGIAIPLYN